MSSTAYPQYPQELIAEYVEKGYWNETTTSELCDRNAALYGNDAALIDSQKRLTWAQVKEQTDRLAAGLLGMGIGHGDVLLGQLPNCVDFFLLRIACAKAGIILIPAAATYRRFELEFILKHSGAKAAVIARKHRNFDYFALLTELQPQIPTLEQIMIIGDDVPGEAIAFEQLLREPQYDLNCLRNSKRNPFEPFEIVASAGSTGIPRLVPWTECSRVFAAKQYVERLKLDHKDVCAAFGPFHAGCCDQLCFHAAVVAGAKVVFLEHFTPQQACELVEQERITAVGLVPTLAVRWLAYPELQRYQLNSLRLILSSTAPLPPHTAAQIEQTFCCPVVQTYGSTESASITVSDLGDSPAERQGTVGKPLAGIEIKIVDDNGCNVSPGEAGVVFVAGPGRPPGLYKDPEGTSQLYTPIGINMGDLGRYDGNGNLVLIGRQKDVIMRGGQNIYPTEVERWLAGHPKIAEAAVIAMPDAEMGEKACAYVVTRPHQELTLAEVVAYLRELGIAFFKFPERLEISDELPKVAGQHKIDKQVLRQDLAQKMEREDSGKVAPTEG